MPVSATTVKGRFDYMATAKGRRAVIYARFSSHNQRDESIEIQLENCRAYCEENGLEVVGEYCDHAQTGRDTKRAGFQRMLADAGKHGFDHVVIYKVTRIMRNRDEMALARITLKRHGVDILYAGEQIGDGSSGILQLGLLEVLAEWESAILSERVRDGIQKNASEGKANGHLMYGWDIVGGYYVVNEREREVLDLARSTIMGGGTVADAVRALEGYRTKQGRRFSQQSLTNMLRRPQNCGTYRYAGHVIEDGMPALWSKEEQAMLEKRMDDPTIQPKAYEGYERYALTGKLYHEHGGELFACYGMAGTGRNGTRYRYYRCRKCRRTVRAESMEAEVAQGVLHALEDEWLRERIADTICAAEFDDSAPSRAELIRSELHEIELTYERVWNAIMAGIAPPGGKERMDELRARQERLEGELRVEEAKESLRIDRDRVLYWLERMSRATDVQIIDLFVSRVIVTEDGGRHVVMMIDEEDPPEGMPDEGGVSFTLNPARPDWNWANHRFALYIIRRGFVLVMSR